MYDFFEDFIRFGHILSKENREILVIYWLSKFNKNSRPDVENKGFLIPFLKSIDIFCQNESLLTIAQSNEKIFEDISKNFFNALDKVKKEEINHHPFQEEEIALIKWREQNTDSLLTNGKYLLKEIQKYYESKDYNFNFFSSQLDQFLSKEAKSFPKEKKDALKQELLDRWEGLLTKKKYQHFLEELDKARQKICEALYRQMEQFMKLKQILLPFTGECGRLWDLSKGLWQNVGFEVLEKYTELLEKEPELQKLAEMLGKMHQAEDELEEEEIKETIIKPYKKIIHAGKSELVGCHESNDINNLLPIELTLLNNPLTELVFYTKFAEKKLLTYQFIGFDLGKKEEQISKKHQVPKKNKRGPIIICVDTSGSMHGTPEYVAKVLCFAITRIALLEKRQCFLISFSTGIQTLELTNFKNNLTELIRFLAMSFHGGTDARPAFREALNQLQTESYEKADVLMISDFIMSALDESTLQSIKAAKEKSTKFHSLIISTAGNPKALEIFDNNWIYHSGRYDSFKAVLKNVRTLNSSIKIE
jgi:uncharacterized protein with von Willebrand factor type A (vWA) domain